MSLRLGKCWQGSTAFLVFQAETAKFDGSRWRGFMQIDLRTRPGRISFIEQKPEDLLAAGAITNIVRKYAPGGRVHSILEHQDSGDIWIPVHSGSLHFFQLTKISPPEFRLLTALNPMDAPDNREQETEYTVVARMSSTGMFTKKISVTVPPPPVGSDGDVVPAGYSNLLAPLLSEMTSPIEITDAGLPAAHLSAAQGKKPPSPDSPLPLYQREARDRLARRLKTLRKSLKESLEKTPEELNSVALEKSARWLKEFSWLVKPGMHELRLDPEQTGQPETVIIPLDPDLTPGSQIDRFFVEAKKAQKGLSLGKKRTESITKNILTLEQDLSQLREGTISVDAVSTMLERHNLAPKNTQKMLSESISRRTNESTNAALAKFRTFKSSTGITLFVGRTAAENDELTKSAKANDWWFHAVGVHGSHVIAQARQVGTTLNPTVLREAGILALHFSNLKENRAGEVYVTRKQNLRKQKGMPAGLWTVVRSETVMIRYEQDELNKLFAVNESGVSTRGTRGAAE